MFCQKCGTQNSDGVNFCNKCGNNLNADNSSLSVSSTKKGVHEQLHLISEEIENLGGFYKLGFYIQGFLLLLFFSIYTLLIGPIIVYFSGKRGWPKNSLIKAVLYYNAYVIVIVVIIMFLIIIISMMAYVFIS